MGHYKKNCRVKKKNGGNTSSSGQGYKDPNSSQGLNFDFDVISFNHYVLHISKICYVEDDALAWWIGEIKIKKLKGCDLRLGSKARLRARIEDLLNTYESSDDNTNAVNAPQEPFVVKQDPGENSSQNPPQIDHNCCYECGDSLDGIFCQRCTYKSCGKGAYIGYNCPLKVPIISNPKPCNNQTIDEFPQTLPSLHPTCHSGDENSFTNDSNFVDDSPNPPPQPPTYTYEFCGNDAYYGHNCPHQVPFTYNPEPCYNQDFNFPQNFQKEKRIEEEQAAKARYWKIFICYDDDDDEESSIPLKDIIISGLPPCVAITPDSPKTDSLIMSEDECECDVPDCDDSQTINFSTYSNPLFDDSTSSDDESSHEEEIHEISFITYSNPLFDLDEEINSSEFNPIHNEDPDSTLKNDRFDTESYLLESLLNRDTFMTFSPKIDSLLKEFADELALFKPISPKIEDSNPEGDIRLVERLLYENLTPRQPEDFHANPNTIIESLPTFPIPVEDNDSLREEIDIFPGPDDSIPSGIESDDFDSEDDDNSTSCPEFESFHVDYPDSGDSTIDVVEDIPVDVPNILPTHPALLIDFDFIPSNDLESDLDGSSPSEDRNKIYDPGICIEVESMRFLTTLPPVIDTLLPFSSDNEDKVFNHGVLAYKEKSPPFSSHRGFKASKLFHQKSPMIARIFEASRARGFVLRSQELHILSFIWESDIQILSTNVYL
ncbi:hypothetical protein Tco_1316532 [Tanacetum coccineum]